MQFKFIEPAGPEYLAERMLRWEAIEKPLGLPPGAEALPEDEQSLHLVAFDKKKVVGCVCFLPETVTEGRIFQMAISEEYRGKGFGRQLLTTLERSLFQKGVRAVYLYVHQGAEGFYQRLGYCPEGEAFAHRGIQHLMMKKVLAPHAEG